MMPSCRAASSFSSAARARMPRDACRRADASRESLWIGAEGRIDPAPVRTLMLPIDSVPSPDSPAGTQPPYLPEVPISGSSRRPSRVARAEDLPGLRNDTCGGFGADSERCMSLC